MAYEKITLVPRDDMASMSTALGQCAKLKSLGKIQSYGIPDNGVGLEVGLMPKGSDATIPHPDGARFDATRKHDYDWYRGYILQKLQSTGFVEKSEIVEVEAGDTEIAIPVEAASPEEVVLGSAKDEV